MVAKENNNIYKNFRERNRRKARERKEFWREKQREDERRWRERESGSGRRRRLCVCVERWGMRINKGSGLGIRVKHGFPSQLLFCFLFA